MNRLEKQPQLCHSIFQTNCQGVFVCNVHGALSAQGEAVELYLNLRQLFLVFL